MFPLKYFLSVKNSIKHFVLVLPSGAVQTTLVSGRGPGLLHYHLSQKIGTTFVFF